ncbi:hypothetical protein D9756_008152 [Leucocoprinus leucothites]|uniref:Cytochrome P450 n=1 Tax=Leucocoprinus leucothites TaxID=201217 RepID=A0A8H5D108_9AGAR|nr:hypothetical protein D9756_008152 [Leucoagaricus leucothites]
MCTIFSSRKDSFIKCQTILAGRAITATSYNDKWRAHRAIAKRWLDQSAVDSCTGDLAEECTRMLQQICPGGIDAFRAVDCYVANNILRTAFATSAESLGPATYERLLELIWEFVLVYLPNPMTKRAKRVHAGFVEILGRLLDDMDERLEKGEVVPDCLAKTLLENREKKHHDRLDMIMLCSAFIIPGFASHPEIQERAHEELDRVVGADRLPTVDDEENLPYIRSIIKEVERLRNPLTLGTPHFSTEDFVYHGHLIPKNAVVVVNTYTIHHNPERYLDPEAFIPERYLNDKTSSSESVNIKDPMQRDHWSFGAG